MLKVHLLRKFAVYMKMTPPGFSYAQSRGDLYYLVVAAKPVSRNLLAELFARNDDATQNNLRTICLNYDAIPGRLSHHHLQQVAFKQTAEQWVDLYQLQELLRNSSMRADEQLRQLIRLYKVHCWLD